MERFCRTCIWHDDFSWGCMNGDSEFCADFIPPDEFCTCWENDEAEDEQ